MLDGKRKWLGVLCGTAAALAMAAAPAQGAGSDPLFVFTPTPPPPPSSPTPPPSGSLSGPCGLAVDSAGRFYVSDYYHHAIDVFSPGTSQASLPGYFTQLANEDPTDGPCGLAFDAANDLYVNNYHRNVAKFSSSFSPGPIFDSNTPTGVAVDAAGNVYVNDRTYIQEYDSSGAPIRQLGNLGNLGNGYAVAVSAFPGASATPSLPAAASTQGYLYVSDAATNTVKVFDPATSTTTPITEIKNPSGAAFSSLRDSAIAVDRVTGDVYIADNTQPQYTESPQATIYVYRPAENAPFYTYRGHLKYNIVDALPPGLAVDNSTVATQGRVYVTSGNTSPASVYAYPPSAATTATPLSPVGSGALSGGSGRAEPLPSSSSEAPPVSEVSPMQTTVLSSPAARRRIRHRRRVFHRHHMMQRRRRHPA
jgi:hypothetical protein